LCLAQNLFSRCCQVAMSSHGKRVKSFFVPFLYINIHSWGFCLCDLITSESSHLLMLSYWWLYFSILIFGKHSYKNSNSTKIDWELNKKLNKQLPPLHSSKWIIGSFSTKNENLCSQESCIWVFIAGLFAIAKTMKQPRCSTVGVYLNKLWYRKAIEYYSTMKRRNSDIGKIFVNS
jgi:hypothetical protein